MNIAIIPARGGSKRVPKKNIMNFFGRPMVAWPIQAALDSALFDHVFVSTDDEEIAEISKKHGAEVPFLRDKILADDITGIAPVIKDFIQTLQRTETKEIKNVTLIYATNPIMCATDLRDSFAAFQQNKDAQFMLSVSSFPSPIQRALVGEKILRSFQPEYFTSRSQDLEETYFDAAWFAHGKVDAWLTNNNLHNNSVPWHIDRWRTQDLDTPADLEMLKRLWILQNDPHIKQRLTDEF